MQSSTPPKLFPYPEAEYSQEVWEELAELANYKKEDIQDEQVREELCFVGRVKYAFDCEDWYTLHQEAANAASQGNVKRVAFLLEKNLININEFLYISDNHRHIKSTLLIESRNHPTLMVYLAQNYKINPEILNCKNPYTNSDYWRDEYLPWNMRDDKTQAATRPKKIFPYRDAPYDLKTWETLATLVDFKKSEVEDRFSRPGIRLIGKTKFAFEHNNLNTMRQTILDNATFEALVKFALDNKYIGVNDVLTVYRNYQQVQTTLFMEAYESPDVMSYLLSLKSMTPETINHRNDHIHKEIKLSNSSYFSLKISSSLQAALRFRFDLVALLLEQGAIPDESDILFALERIKEDCLLPCHGALRDKYYMVEQMVSCCKSISPMLKNYLAYIKENKGVTYKDYLALQEAKQLHLKFQKSRCGKANFLEQFKTMALKAAQESYPTALSYLISCKLINPNDIFETEKGRKHTLLTAACQPSRNYSILKMLLKLPLHENTLNFSAYYEDGWNKFNILEVLVCILNEYMNSEQFFTHGTREVLADLIEQTKELIKLLLSTEVKPVDHEDKWITTRIKRESHPYKNFHSNDIADLAETAIKKYEERQHRIQIESQLSYKVSHAIYTGVQAGINLFSYCRNNRHPVSDKSAEKNTMPSIK